MRLEPQQVTAVRNAAAAQEVMAPPAANYGLTRPEVAESAVYRSLHQLLRAMGLDAGRFGSSVWNPLQAILAPGEHVVIKPNLVFHRHYREGRLHGIVTDPRLIRALADLVFRAIGREGRLVIGDAPLQSADWKALMEASGLEALPDYYARQGLRCELRDFRTIESRTHRGLKLEQRPLAGDPGGYGAVDLGADSLHHERPWQQYRVTNYDPQAMRQHHNEDRHEYLVSGSILAADCVINVAKLKTHRKSGLTGPLKNFVGINGCKDWLPHHTKGSKLEGGDEYSSPAAWKRLSTWLVEREETAACAATKCSWNAMRRAIWLGGKQWASDHSWEGSWHGNDTLWRTIVDLNRAAVYADRQGQLCKTPQRKLLVLVDALLAGDGEGPMAPSPVPLGVVLGGANAAAVELAATRLARWPVDRLPLLEAGFAPHRFPLARFSRDQVQVEAHEYTPGGLREAAFEDWGRFFEPCAGWRGLFEQQPALPQELLHA